ncbi:MAG TPA: S8 family serine peptidase, partial [Actinomycetota bacterium]|nr:S8 family serine peptidase [Actinomycetota bacterium]
MRDRAHLRTAVAALLALLGSAVPGRALREAPRASDLFVPGEVMIQFSSPAAAAKAEGALRRAGATLAGRIDQLHTLLVRVPGDATAAATVMRSIPGVEAAEVNLIGRVQGAPPPSRANDPLVKGIGPTFGDRQWYLNRINAPYSWMVHPSTYYSARTKVHAFRDLEAVKIAVVDTWIDTDHNDWKNAGGVSTDADNGGQLALDDAIMLQPAKDLRGPIDWHGTHVAGIIGASTDNELDIAGIAYSAQIMPVVVARGDGMTNAFAIAKGISMAVDRGAKVVNVSLAIQNQKANQVSVLRSAVNRAVAKGAVVVAAAGNDRSGDDAEYPAGFAAENAGVIAVGASDFYDERAFCSKKGRHISVVAPGVLMWGLDPQNHRDSRDHTIRREVCGTSYAAAVVSGIAGLVAGKYRGIKPVDIARRIAQGADDLGKPGRDDDTGAGRVNAERALWPGGGAGSSWLAVPVAGEKGHVDVLAAAQSFRGVTQAEITVDGMQRGKGIAMRPTDGRWGSRGERLIARLDTSKLAEGPHELHVRAKDASGRWGPASSSVMIVDRTPPTLAGVTCYPQAAVYPDDPSAAIRFSIADAWSPHMSVKIVLLDPSFTPAVEMVYPSVPTGTYGRPLWSEIEAAAGGPITPGLYRLIVTVKDMAAHEVWSESPCLVLPTTRAVPSPNASNGAGGLPG